MSETKDTMLFSEFIRSCQTVLEKEGDAPINIRCSITDKSARPHLVSFFASENFYQISRPAEGESKVAFYHLMSPNEVMELAECSEELKREEATND